MKETERMIIKAIIRKIAHKVNQLIPPKSQQYTYPNFEDEIENLLSELKES